MVTEAAVLPDPDNWLSPAEQRFMVSLRGRDESIMRRIGHKLYEEALEHAQETVDALAVVMCTFQEIVMSDDPRESQRYEWIAAGFADGLLQAANARHHLKLYDDNGEPRPRTELARSAAVEANG
jgi:hypothetical protein